MDPTRYGGWDERLNASETDARDLAAMAAGGCVELMPPSQTPNYYVIDSATLAFEGQAPFTL